MKMQEKCGGHKFLQHANSIKANIYHKKGTNIKVRTFFEQYQLEIFVVLFLLVFILFIFVLIIVLLFFVLVILIVLILIVIHGNHPPFTVIICKWRVKYSKHQIIFLYFLG